MFLALQKPEYSHDDAFVYAIASALVYCPKERIEKGECKMASNLAQQHGLYPIHTYENNATVNHIAYTILHRKRRNEIIIAFSGTTNWNQLMLEFVRAFPVQYKIHPAMEEARVVEYFYTFYVDHFREDLMNTIENHLEIHPADTVVFTGHSLGGAMSFHGAVDAMLSNLIDREKILLYTFGQPRVGNIDFIEIINNGTKGVYRVVHNKDTVAHVPPCVPHLIDGGCIESGFLPFYPIHTMTEVWYEEGMEKYKICNQTIHEDPECSYSVSNNSINDHYYYFGLRIASIYDIDPVELENQQIGSITI